MKIRVNLKSAWWVVLTNLLLLLMIIYCITHMIFLNQIGNGNHGTITNKKTSDGIDVVASLDDPIGENTAWCGTFQVVWNEMSDKVVKKDIVFFKQLPIVENLNKRSFTKDDVSEDYLYVTYGLKTLDKKEEIKKSIKEKFNEESKILDQISWDGAPQSDDGYDGKDIKKYLSYSMLVKEFEYEKEFDTYEDRSFTTSDKQERSGVKYFGVSGSSKSELREQVDVLYYNSEDNFAIKLKTKGDDEIYIVSGEEEKTFNDIYERMLDKTSKYEGKVYFSKNDYLQIPTLSFNIQKQFDELIVDDTKDKYFTDIDDNLCSITDALQVIEMSIDEKGGKVKSEAYLGMDVETTAFLGDKVDYRYFYFNKPFTLFIKEKDKKAPYFATTVDDVALYQELSK